MNKIQGMGGHQLSGIQEHWKQFITWWPETIKWPSNWWRTNWASPVRGFVRFFIKIREQEWPVLYSESRTWTKEVQSHNFHPNMSYQSTLCWLHHYCRRVTGVSAFSQDKISEHRVKNTVITETQNILLAKVKYQNDDHCFWLSVYLNEKQWLLNSMHRWWKSYQCWVKEREAAHDFPEKCICSSLAQCPSLFLFGTMPQLVPPWQWSASWWTGVCWRSATHHISRHWWHKKEFNIHGSVHRSMTQ